MQRIDSVLVAQYTGTPVQPIVDLARLARAWGRVAGEPWRSASWPLRLQNGILFLAVADSSWAQRLAYDGRMLSRKVERFLGYGVKLRHRIVPPEPVKPGKRLIEPDFDNPSVELAVATLPDGPLRESLKQYFAYLSAFQREPAPQAEPTEENSCP